MISIVIVNYNGGEKIKKSVQSVLNQREAQFELIIIDNGSTDRSIEQLKLNTSKSILIKLDKNYGFTAGCNLGINASKGEHIMILNNDAYLSTRETLKNAVVILENTSNDICGLFPKVLFNWEKNIINSTYSIWHEDIMWYDSHIGSVDNVVFKNQEKELQVFGAMFIAPIFKKTALEIVGPFDESMFTYGEDFDMSYRLNLLGFKFIYTSKINIYHDFRSTSKDTTDPMWSYFYYLRNYLIVILKCYEFKNLTSKFSGYTLHLRRAVIYSIKTKDIKRFLTIVKSLFSLLLLSPIILKNRYKIQKYRKVKDEEIWSKDFVINFNPFFYNSMIVLNAPNMSKFKI